MAPSIIRGARASRLVPPRFLSVSPRSLLGLAPVPVVHVGVVIGDRVELVLLPRTLALSPHVLAELAARCRALLVLNASVKETQNAGAVSRGRPAVIGGYRTPTTHSLSASEK